MNKPLKVIQIIDSLNPGGAEMMAVNIANGLLTKNVNSYICSTRLEGALKDKIDANVGYQFLNKKKSIDFKAFFKLHQYLKNNSIKIIHAHSSSFFIAFVMKILNYNRIIIWHDHYGKSERLKDREKQSIKITSILFTHIISVNKLLLQWAKKELYSKSVSYIPNFANLESKQIDNTILKGEKGKRIVCLANLRAQKDHFNLINAFIVVQKQYSDWTLHLVGVDNKDVYSDNIKSLIITKSLENCVFVYGSRMDIANILEQTSIGVLSSKSEGLPVALLEYGLAKLPVVITNVGDCKEVIENNVNGFLITAENAIVLADKIIELIQGAKKRNQFGLNLYNKVILKYSEDNYLEQLLKIYNCA